MADERRVQFGRCSRCLGEAEGLPGGSYWWHTGRSCHGRVYGPWPQFELRAPVEPEPELGRLPERLSSAADALVTIRELWDVLAGALEPGSASRVGGRYGAEATPLSPLCECGARRYWRRRVVDELEHLERFPVLRGQLGDEQARTYCLRCDGGPVSLGESPLPLAVAVHDALVDVEHTVIVVEHNACRVLGLTKLPAAATVPARAGHLLQLLPAIERDEVLVAKATRELLSAARLTRRVLRDREPVIQVPGRCPWCESQSLVLWPERGDTNAFRIDGGMAWVAGVVECTFRGCECDDEACRCRRRDEERDGRRPLAGYRHTWANNEWMWLSQLIGVNLFDVVRETVS